MVRAGDRPEYFPVYYVTPLTGNEAAFGFDLASNVTRRNTLEVARDSGEIQATGPIDLVQLSEFQTGFLAVVPLYAGFPQTLAQRQETLTGFILGVYQVHSIFQSATLGEKFTGNPDGLQIFLVDETDPEHPQILYSSTPETTLPITDRYFLRKSLPDIFGRHWSLITYPSPTYIAG